METVIQGSTLQTQGRPARHRPRAWGGRLRGGELGVEPGCLSAARTAVVAGGAADVLAAGAFRPGRRGIGRRGDGDGPRRRCGLRWVGS